MCNSNHIHTIECILPPDMFEAIDRLTQSRFDQWVHSRQSGTNIKTTEDVDMRPTL